MAERYEAVLRLRNAATSMPKNSSFLVKENAHKWRQVVKDVHNRDK